MREYSLLRCQSLRRIWHKQALQKGEELGRDVRVVLKHLDRVDTSHALLEVLSELLELGLVCRAWAIVFDQARVDKFKDQDADCVEVMGKSDALSGVVDPILLTSHSLGVQYEHLWRHGMHSATGH